MLKSILVIMIFMVNAAFASNAVADLMGDYLGQINYSCNEDSDCVIKDVGNCCGYYPKCVNSDAKVSRDTVEKVCSEGGLIGVCGFPSIKSCECSGGKCIGINGSNSDR